MAIAVSRSEVGMSLPRYGPGVVLALLLLDIAPTGPTASVSSCGSRPEPRLRSTTWLEVWVSDCSCVPGVVRVSVDGAFGDDFLCGSAQPAEIPVAPGTHVVTASSGSAVAWSPRTVEAPQGEITTIDLGCPPS
jgi:hypothetical protein